MKTQEEQPRREADMSPLPIEDGYGLFVDTDGTRVTLDKRACGAVRMTLGVIEGGKSRTSDDDPLISTGAAAEMLGVSRRTVTRIMDAGDLPFVREGKGHRRVRLSEVLRYKDKSDRRSEVLSELRGYLHDEGLEDIDFDGGHLAEYRQED
jgi:excisionase family DNA binding protein